MNRLDATRVLRLHCPRCDAIGHAIPSMRDPSCFEVLWADGEGTWLDGSVTGNDLANPSYGCGHCPITRSYLQNRKPSANNGLSPEIRPTKGNQP